MSVISQAIERSARFFTGQMVPPATLDWSSDLVEDVQSVDLHHLPRFTTVLVLTMNSLYRVVITRGPQVCVQGGVFFPNLTSAYLDGALVGGSSLGLGWIGVGLPVEIRSGGRRIVTSRVRAITTVQPSGSVVL
jgi:hypothetical protein